MNKKNLIIYIALVSLLFVIFITTLLYKQSIQSNTNPGCCDKNPEPIVQKNISEDINLKTYTNTSLKYSIDIPSDWTIQESKYENQKITFNSPETEDILKDIISGKEWGEGYGEDIQIQKYNNLSDLVGEYFLYDETVNKKSIKNLEQVIDLSSQFAEDSDNPQQKYSIREINGLKAYDTTLGGFGAYDTILIQSKTGSIYEIVFWDSFPEKYNSVKQQIINSFKVL